ncbi:MAG TPA: MFS transporter, partial [Ktedonobacteraceae bacterium]|nr:MFS transporter [Ktedonobacteraceae bacterium]
KLTLRQRLRELTSPAWLTRDMRLLLAARVSMSAARALAGIVVPIYLALIGFNALELGFLFVVVAIMSAVLSGLSGLLADRVGRKPMIVLLPFCTALAAIIFVYSHVAALLFVFAALGSFGRGAGAGAGAVGPYQPAEQALLADAVSSRYRNNLFGLVGFASSLGALLGTGPLTSLPQVLTHFSILSSQGLASYQFAFFLTAIAAAIAGLLAIPVADPSLTRIRNRRAMNDTSAQTIKRKGLWRINISHQSMSILLRLCITNSFNGLAVGFFGPFITYWFYRQYGAGPAVIGLLYSIINLAAMFANLGSARFAARLGLVRAILVGRIFQAVLLIPMVLAPTFWLAGAIYLARMLAQRLALPLRQSYVMGVVSPEERGTVSALSNLPAQATSAASPALAGYLFDHISLALPFEIGAALQAFNALLFFIFFRNNLPPEERDARSLRENAETLESQADEAEKISSQFNGV